MKANLDSAYPLGPFLDGERPPFPTDLGFHTALAVVGRVRRSSDDEGEPPQEQREQAQNCTTARQPHGYVVMNNGWKAAIWGGGGR